MVFCTGVNVTIGSSDIFSSVDIFSFTFSVGGAWVAADCAAFSVALKSNVIWEKFLSIYQDMTVKKTVRVRLKYTKTVQ